MAARCRSCGAEIVWVVSENGKPMPLDAKPVVTVPRGLFVVKLRDRVEVAISVESGPLHQSHFASCPNAKEHRK